MTKKSLLFFLALFIALNITLIRTESFSKKNMFQYSEFPIHLSYESSLAFGEYVYFYRTAGEGDKIRWEFSGTNSYVGITVLAMSDIEFNKFQNAQTFYTYTLSNGSFYIASGTFYPPSYDTWYIVFLNADSSVQTTYLTYDINVVKGDDGLFESILYPIITVVIIGAIIGAGIEIFKKKKQKEEREIIGQTEKLSRSPHTPTNEVYDSIKYCSQCGSSQMINAVYCVKCGNKFAGI